MLWLNTFRRVAEPRTIPLLGGLGELVAALVQACALIVNLLVYLLLRLGLFRELSDDRARPEGKVLLAVAPR